MIKLFTKPQFSLVDTDKSEPVLIKGTKTKRLIALLALAPDYTRSRAWVKKRLWSDRSEEQAAGSLRQCISEVRKSLGVHNHILLSDSINLSLDNALFCLDATPASQLANDIPELAYEYLEDLDSIKDRRFCLWLTSVREKNREKHKVAHARQRSSVVKPSSGNFMVIFDQSFGNGLHENVLGNQLLTSVSKFLLEMPKVTIVGSEPTDENPLKANQVRGCRLSV